MTETSWTLIWLAAADLVFLLITRTFHFGEKGYRILGGWNRRKPAPNPEP
jgi:hypothetical protein